MVTVVGADRGFAFFAFRRSVVALRILAIHAHASAFPGPGDLDQAVGGCAPFDALAACAHDGEKRLNPMDAVPEKVGMRFFQVTGTGGLGAQDLADGTVADGLGVFSVAER